MNMRKLYIIQSTKNSFRTCNISSHIQRQKMTRRRSWSIWTVSRMVTYNNYRLGFMKNRIFLYFMKNVALANHSFPRRFLLYSFYFIFCYILLIVWLYEANMEIIVKFVHIAILTTIPNLLYVFCITMLNTNYLIILEWIISVLVL